jgi:hypothetical protein
MPAAAHASGWTANKRFVIVPGDPGVAWGIASFITNNLEQIRSDNIDDDADAAKVLDIVDHLVLLAVSEEYVLEEGAHGKTTFRRVK